MALQRNNKNKEHLKIKFLPILLAVIVFFLYLISVYIGDMNPFRTKSVAQVVSSSKGDIPAELISLWKFKSYYKFKANAWVSLNTTGIPIPIRYIELTKEGSCRSFDFDPSGQREGFRCYQSPPTAKKVYPKYDKVKVSSDHIYFSFWTPSSPDLYGMSYSKPTDWKINEDGDLELYVLDSKGDKYIKYIYQKLAPDTSKNPSLVFNVDKTSVPAGQDIILSGSVNTNEIVRIFLRYKKNGKVFSFNNVGTTEKCDGDYCNSPAIIDRGNNVEPVLPMNVTTSKMMNDGSAGIGPNTANFLSGYYVECPFASNATICVKPASDGSFSVKIWNPGYTPTTDVTLYAKTNNSLIEKSVSVKFEGEKTLCRPPVAIDGGDGETLWTDNIGVSGSTQGGGSVMVRTPISCPTSPEWNKRKREFSKLYVPAQILESPPAVSPDSSKSYVDLKINGSDGPIKIKAGESALNITYTTNTGKYCILVQGGKGLYWDWDITAVSKYSSIPEFDTLFTQNRSALVYLRLYAKDIQKYLYEYKTMQLHRISLNIFCNTTGYKFTSRTLLLSDPALLKDKVEIQVVP